MNAALLTGEGATTRDQGANRKLHFALGLSVRAQEETIAAASSNNGDRQRQGRKTHLL